MTSAAMFPASPRLQFRAWADADLSLATSLWTDLDVMRYLGGPMSPQEVMDRLDAEMDRQRTLGVQYWPIFLRDSGSFAGCAGLRPFHQEPGVFELGVHLARAVWGKRLGEEASRAVLRFGFGQLHAVAITAGHNPENLNSKALILRLGMTFTHCEPWGRFRIDTPFYRLGNPAAGPAQECDRTHPG